MLKLRSSLVLFILPFACGAASAQVLYGSLTGNVLDPSSAAIPDAKVEAANVNTGVSAAASTDARGVYLFSNLQPGVYKITVNANGFQTAVEENVRVGVNEVKRADFQVKIAQANQTIEVTTDVTLLQTDRSDVHQQISSQEIEELPYNGGQGKNFQSLLYLTPGAGVPVSREANSDAGNPQRAQTLFMNGVSSSGNSTKLDGATVAYPWLPVNIAYVPPSEAIEAVNITTNDFDAEQGAAGGAAVNVQIKSGTNSLHGVLFERNQNNDMTAVNYFAHTSPLNKNIFNQFGFAVGGPVWLPKVFNGRNKLFWFVDWQGTRHSLFAADPNLTLPTPAMRTGDLSASPNPIYDPLTGNPDGTGRLPFGNNQIPASRIDPASAALANLLPGLTRPSSFTNNYDAYGSYTFNRDNVDVKINYDPTSRAQIWGRYSISPMDIYAPFVLGKAAGDVFNGGNPGHAGGRVQSTGVGFTYTLSPTLLLDGNVGYTRQNIGATGDPQDGDFGTDVLHIPGTNGVGPNYQGIPGFQVLGLANMGNTNTGSPFQFRDNQYTSAYNVGKVKGAHNLRFGFQYDHYALNHFQPQGGTFGTARGSFGFDGSLAALKGGPQINVGGPFNSWAQFLLGFPSRVGKVTQFANPNALRFSDWALYARDQWQVTRNLTVNYGLRWEYYPIYSHDNYGAVRFDPATYDILIGCEGGVPCDAAAHANKKDFAPRLGLAYRLGSKTVIRTGYGITVDPDNMRNQRNDFPSVVNQDFNPANSYQFVSFPGVPQVSLRNGIPAPTYPDITHGVFSPSSTPSLTTYLPSVGTATFPAELNRGYIQSWNFFAQRQLSETFVAEVGYAGTHAVHTMTAVNINGAAPGTGTAGRQLYPYVTSDLNSYTPFGSQKYNGLQTRLRKNWGGSLVAVSYTFSKALNTGGAYYSTQFSPEDNGDASLFRTFPVSTSFNKGLAGFDRTHTLNISHVYQIPVGQGRRFLNHGWAAQVFGGFQISGVLSRYSGVPFTVTANNSSLNAPGQQQTADQVNPVVKILGGHDSYTPYFDVNAFSQPVGPRLGTTGRNILRGPGFFNMDQSISRTFAFKEGRVRLQFVGEAFNLTNTPSFAVPASGYTPSTTNPDGGINYNNFGVITGTVSSARQLQVGAYLRF